MQRGKKSELRFMWGARSGSRESLRWKEKCKKERERESKDDVTRRRARSAGLLMKKRVLCQSSVKTRLNSRTHVCNG